METQDYIESALAGFIADPCDSKYQQGYLSALLDVYETYVPIDDWGTALTALREQTLVDCA